MDFFEVNLPESLPYLVSTDMVQAYKAAVHSITARTAKLNKALELSGLEPNKFHQLAKVLFDQKSKDPNTILFDERSAEEIAAFVKLIDDGVPTEPRLEWPNATVLFDTAFTTVKEWESLRHIGIGGSDSAVVMEQSPFRSQRQLYHDKIGTPMPGKSEQNNIVFARGHAVEEKILEAFAKYAGATRIPESRMFASKKFPHSTANIDGIMRMADGKIFVLEAKTTIEENKAHWLGDKVPRYYMTQVRQYPAVLDDDRVCGTYISAMFVVDYSIKDLFVDATFDGGKLITHLIERNKDAETSLLEEEQAFWSDYIEAGIEPPSGDPMLEKKLVSEMVGPAVKTKGYVPLSGMNQPLAEKYFALTEEKKIYEKQADRLSSQIQEIKNEICLELGEETVGRISVSPTEYYEVKFAPTKGRTTCDIDALRVLFPEAYNATVTTEPQGYRRFALKKVQVK